MKRGVIAAGDPVTAKVGQEILLAGGNAFDASIAASFASFVSESTLTSIGGGGFGLTWSPDREPVIYDFFCQTPRHPNETTEPDFYEADINFQDSIQKFHIGLATAAVPGNIAGLLHMHKKLGRMPLADVLLPAKEIANNGVKVTPYIRYNFHVVSDILLAEEDSRDIYKPGGKLLDIGDRYYFPHYADLIEDLILEGKDAFYRGEYAKSIAKDCLERGGHLTREDFENYKVIERKPYSFSYKDHQILVNPPPSSGGILIAFMLKLLERVNFEKITFGSAPHLEAIIESMIMTSKSRKDYLDSRHHEENMLEEFMDEGRLTELKEAISKRVSNMPNTTHITVVDRDQNISCITTSFGTGCGYNIPGTHSMLNNMLGEEDLNPGGFNQWPHDHRITSMMAPTIVLKAGMPVFALGTGGANRIRTAIFQTILNLLEFKLEPDRVINAPRIHWEDGLLSIEPGYGKEVIDKLAKSHNCSTEWYTSNNMFFGGVQGVIHDNMNNPIGVGDRRREGIVLYA